MVTISDVSRNKLERVIYDMKQFTNTEKEKINPRFTNSLSNFDSKKILEKLDLTNNFATDYYTTFR